MATEIGIVRPRTHPFVNGARVLLLYAGALVMLVLAGTPFVFMVLTAFKRQDEYLTNLWGLPKSLLFSNFTGVVTNGIGRYFLNSLIVSVVAVLLTVLLAALASYPLARMRFRLGKPLFLLFLAGSMIPVHVTLIPIYMLSRELHIYDTLIALLGPYVGFNLPLAVFILTEFFRQIPGEIEDAARIDGAGTLEIFWRIIMPLSVPALSTVAIYAFIFMWNEFIFALVLLSSQQHMTIPLGLMQFYGQYQINVPGIMAALTLASVPVVLVYLVAQERVIAGLVAGAVKG